MGTIVPHGPRCNHAGRAGLSFIELLTCLISRELAPTLNSLDISPVEFLDALFLRAATRLSLPLLLVAVSPKRRYRAAV